MSDNLIDFLRARLAEDEQVACATGGRWWQPPAQPTEVLDSGGGGFNTFLRSRAAHIARHDPGRALAEVDAKRRIIDRYERQVAKAAENAMEEDRAWILGEITALLALPHASHPDYNNEWRP